MSGGQWWDHPPIAQPPTVDIADVTADAVRVPASSVRVGDYVFSTTGQRDRVIRATHNKRSTITPERLWPIVCDPDETITVVRAGTD